MGQSAGTGDLAGPGWKIPGGRRVGRRRRAGSVRAKISSGDRCQTDFIIIFVVDYDVRRPTWSQIIPNAVLENFTSDGFHSLRGAFLVLVLKS